MSSWWRKIRVFRHPPHPFLILSRKRNRGLRTMEEIKYFQNKWEGWPPTPLCLPYRSIYQKLYITNTVQKYRLSNFRFLIEENGVKRKVDTRSKRPPSSPVLIKFHPHPRCPICFPNVPIEYRERGDNKHPIMKYLLDSVIKAFVRSKRFSKTLDLIKVHL